MKEFVFGTDAQYKALDRELSGGRNYKFANRRLPASCTPDRASLWFGKTEGTYRVCIDRGITANGGSADFRTFLERGETKFTCMEDMADFFRSLRGLYVETTEDSVRARGGQDEPSQRNSNASPGVTPRPDPGGEQAPAVDMDKLRKAMSEMEEEAVPVWPEQIADGLEKEVFGQSEAINELAKKIAVNRMRVPSRILCVGLLGPTGVGKSETGKNLASVLTREYGREFGFIDIKANQMVGEHAVNSFFGAPPGYVGYGDAKLLDPVRSNPDHVIVVEEIEKANPTVLTGLMEAIDTGILDTADGSGPIDLNRSIMLFTSNIPVDLEKYRRASPFERGELCRDAFTKHCGRPEISGKIGSFIVYDSLDPQARASMINKFVWKELKGYGMELKEVEPHLMCEFVALDTKYGARPLGILVSDAIGEQLMSHHGLKAYKGEKVTLSGTIGDIRFKKA